MTTSISQLCAILSLEDETTVLELLDISSEELVDTFKHKVRERKLYLSKHYEEDLEEQSSEGSLRKHSEATGLGSKQVWKDAGFDLEEDSY